MATKKISELAAAAAADGSEQAAVVQGGVTVRMALTAMLTWITAQLAARLLPAGGATREALVKSSATAYDASWVALREVPLPAAPGDNGKALVASGSSWSWQLVPAAGTTDAVQYKTGGGELGGASLIRIAPSGSLRALEDSSTTPASADSVILRGQHLAGLCWPGAIDEEGHAAALQWSLSQRRIASMIPPGGSNVPSVVGMLAWSITGSGGGTTVSFGGSLYGSLREYAQASAATAGSSCGYRHALVTYGLGTAARMGGFLASWTFGISDAAAVADARMFVGLIGSAAAIGNVNPTTLTNVIGVGCDNGASQLVIIHNDGSGTATSVPLSAAFPANTRSTDVYRLTLFAPPNSTWVGWTIENITSGAVLSGKITSDLPAGTVTLAPQFWRNNGATALAVRLSVGGFYSETLF